MPGKFTTRCFGLMIVLLLLGSGCVDTLMMYHNNPVEHVVKLQENGPIKGVWETFDLIINYQYVQTAETLELSGQVALSQHYQMVYEQLRRIDTYLFLVDKDSRVLETVAFEGLWPGPIDSKNSFALSRKLPKGTQGFSFGYSAQVAEQEGRGKSFYLLPLKHQE